MPQYFVHPSAIVESEYIGEDTRIWAFAHVCKGARIGRNCNIGDHCYIEDGAVLGDDVVVKNGVSIWRGVTIHNRVFIGPNVVFTNDRFPRAKVYHQEYDKTELKEGASIGANATLICPIVVGKHALVGAGSVVVEDVPDFGLVYGNPARLAGFVCRCGHRLPFEVGQDGVAVCEACSQHFEKRGVIVREKTPPDSAWKVGFDASAQRAKSNRSIPLVDLLAQHKDVRSEIEKAIWEVIEASSFIGGTFVEEFEQKWAAFCGAAYAVACASGTDGLRLSLMSVGVPPDSEVITVPLTFIATVEAIHMVGAQPIFVDIDERTYTLSPEKLREFLEMECYLTEDGQTVNKKTGRRVTAIIPVHLYGLPAHMEPILSLAEKFRLAVIEDACQAHGAIYRLGGVDKRAGTLGQTGVFSFYPSKNLGAMGDGGIVTTNDAHKALQMRMWREHGQVQRYIHISPHGFNSRLDALQAAVLLVKLRRLEEWNERRRRIASWYRQRLAHKPVILPSEPDYAQHVYHLFVIRVRERDQVRLWLEKHGISTGLHYPVPLHLQRAYEYLGYKEGSFPVSEAVARSALSLPMHPYLSESQVDYICEVLCKAIDEA